MIGVGLIFPRSALTLFRRLILHMMNFPGTATNGLSTISVKFKPGILKTWPRGLYRYMYFKNFEGCYDLSRWQKLPYVPYDSIQLTDKPLFFSLVLGHSDIIDPGILYTEIFAKPNSGIDLRQKVSVGFTMFTTNHN